MAANIAFMPIRHTIAIATNATPATATSQLLLATDFGFPANNAQGNIVSAGFPQNVRILNASANVVFVNFTNLTQVAVLPVTFVGSPATAAPQWGMLPGTSEVFGVPDIVGKQQCWINTIAAVGASNLLYIGFGEGL